MGQGQRSRSGRPPQAAQGFLADLQRRLLRQALQRAHSDQPVERQAPDAGLDDPRNARSRHRQSTVRFGAGAAPASVIVGGEGPGDIDVGGGTIKASALEVDGILYFTMPDNAWAVDARDGARTVALLLEDQGRHAHRQSRPGHVEQLPVHGDARRLSGLARRQDRQGALAQGDRRSGAGILLHAGAGRRRQSRAGGHRQRYRCPGLPAVVRSGNRAICNGSSIPCR